MRRLQQILAIEAATADEALRSYRAATDGYDYSRATRIATTDAEQCRALASQLPELIAAQERAERLTEERDAANEYAGQRTTEVVKLEAELRSSQERAERLEAEKTALIDKSVWETVNGWYATGVHKKPGDRHSKRFDDAQAALDAYHGVKQ